MEAVLQFAGGGRRAGDLYATRSAVSRARAVFRGLQGVENVYTQHTPLLSATLTMLSLDRLEPASYPYMSGSQVGGWGSRRGGERRRRKRDGQLVVGERLHDGWLPANGG